MLESEQQCIVDLLISAYNSVLFHPELHERLHTIKQHFVDREYAKVFVPENLQYYIVQYIPTRIMLYYFIFSTITSIRNEITKSGSSICCIGGGPGSELVALSYLSNKLNLSFKVDVFDVQDWKEAISPLLDEKNLIWKPNIEEKFYICNVLTLHSDFQNFVKNSNLITILFTINELFNDRSKGLKFLSFLQKNMQQGAKLLILDSAGSFSHVKIGNSTHMIYKLCDYVEGFKVLHSEDSTWFRLENELKYPLKIQNQRYFIRVYEKI